MTDKSTTRPQSAISMRIFLGEDDRFEGKPLYEVIVTKAREAGLAGAIVLRGPLGFGHDSQLHTAKILRLSADLPMVIEIIDDEPRIEAFLAELDPMMTGGLIMTQRVQVRHYGGRRDQ